MISYRILCAGLALLGVAATASGNDLSVQIEKSDSPGENLNDVSPESNQDTLRLVTVIALLGEILVPYHIEIADMNAAAVKKYWRSQNRRQKFTQVHVVSSQWMVMRHGERAPADTYPNDLHVNSTMEPFGWGQLTNKGRKNVYRTGEFLRQRYDNFLGSNYTPQKYWLQTSSIDRTKMTGLILSAALWKPTEKQAFLPGVNWQPVSLHYWERSEDRLLIIWNACPRLTFERTHVENATEVRRFNEENKQLYRELADLTGLPMNSSADVASLYSTLKAETAMNLPLPEWTMEYFPARVEPAACFSLSMNVFTDNLRKLAGGPLVTAILDSMVAKSLDTLKPENRKMYVYVGHDSTLVNMLSAMGVWNGRDPDFGCTIIVELHEHNGSYSVQIFQKDLPDEAPYSLTVPGCEAACPLGTFAQLMKTVIIDDYEEACGMDDPNYVVPPTPPA